eukprot:scaffold51261_cov567-Isochrysis_galbana.AAC.1
MQRLGVYKAGLIASQVYEERISHFGRDYVALRSTAAHHGGRRQACRLRLGRGTGAPAQVGRRARSPLWLPVGVYSVLRNARHANGG